MISYPHNSSPPENVQKKMKINVDEVIESWYFHFQNEKTIYPTVARDQQALASNRRARRPRLDSVRHEKPGRYHSLPGGRHGHQQKLSGQFADRQGRVVPGLVVECVDVYFYGAL